MEEEAWQEFQASAIITDREEQDWQEQGLGMGTDSTLSHISITWFQFPFDLIQEEAQGFEAVEVCFQ